MKKLVALAAFALLAACGGNDMTGPTAPPTPWVGTYVSLNGADSLVVFPGTDREGMCSLWLGDVVIEPVNGSRYGDICEYAAADSGDVVSYVVLLVDAADAVGYDFEAGMPVYEWLPPLMFDVRGDTLYFAPLDLALIKAD